MAPALKKKQAAQIKAWLASLTDSDRKVAERAARDALAKPKRQRDRYDGPAQKTQDEPLDLTDPDGNDLPNEAQEQNGSDNQDT